MQNSHMSPGLRFFHPELKEELKGSLQMTTHDPIIAEDLIDVSSLDCSNFTFDHRDIPILCSCRNLEKLAMNIGCLPLDFLSAFPKLRSLDLTYWDPGNIMDCSPLQSLTSLEYLWLSGGDISSIQIQGIQVITGLRKLKTLGFHKFGSVDLDFLKRMPWIETFYCGFGNDVRSIDAVRFLPNLKELTLDDLTIEDQSFLDVLPTCAFIDLCGLRFPNGFDPEPFERYPHKDISEIHAVGTDIVC